MTAPDGQLDDDEIEVMPTKLLFVDMLTKDIALSRAVIDLVDNSIDGARRLRPARDSDLSGLNISVDVSATKFDISDNCGGIPIELARKYAFRIGRPREMESTPNSVGQFGVGMKRALFKFGRNFEVKSTTHEERFSVKVNVDQWLRDDEDWKFKFSSTERGLVISEEMTGTSVTVTDLRPPVAAAFELAHFRNALAREIQAAEQQYIDRGLTIKVAGKTLIATPWKLLQSEGSLAPTFLEWQYSSGGEETVHVRLYAGIGKSSPSNAGWYVFCNGRMILQADQSSATGWNDLGATTEVPRFHNQFARFQGYVFFDCEDATRLPWNTTKTGVDGDSAIFQDARLKMVEAMRPIIDFLNDLDGEKDESAEHRPLETAVGKAVLVPLRSITRTGVFQRPQRVPPSGPPQVRISYSKPAQQVDELQQALNVTSRKQAGETSFDLAYQKYVRAEE